MAGTLTISTLSDGTNSTSSTNCIQGSAKAWVYFNGLSPYNTIKSYNVSSVTNNGAGDYTINLTTALADANYSWVGSGRGNGAGQVTTVMENMDNVLRTSSALRIYTLHPSSAGNSFSVSGVFFD